MSVREGKRRQRAREERRKTNPGSTGTEMTDDVVKDIIKGRTDEQERVQQKVFAEWINTRFAQAGSAHRVKDLFHDLRTGVNLAALAEILTGVKVPIEKGRTRLHHVCNIAKTLEILEQNDIKLASLNVSADDIEDGNTKLTLSLTWAIIQQFYVKRLGGAVANLRISNLEKTLLCWYHHVDVRNLSTSWTDGLAFNALIHKYRDDLFDYTALLTNTAEVNLAHAFKVAEENLGVAQLLDPEDLVQGTPDQKSVVTYLLCLLEVLPREPMEAKVVAAISEMDNSMSNGDKPISDPSAYQLSVESMLTWMLSVEEKLDRCELADNLPEIRKLWDEHEGLLSELLMQEHSLRHILDHSARLLQNPKLPAKRVADVENDVSVLTEKWENIQIKSTERTKLLQKMITILQEEHLKSVDIWLSDADKRVESLKANANSIESMDAQLRELSKLQDDLEKQLPVMNELLAVVVIGVDGADNGTQLQLDDFRQRWETVCRWSETQWSIVRRIRTFYEDFFKLCNECGEWITNRIELLQGLPTVAGDRLDWVQRNVDLLHEMHDQMLDYQERIQTLQERSDELVTYFSLQSSTGMQVRRREEKICSEWNHLVDLLEFWTSDKNMRFDKSDVLRTSKIRHSKRFSDTVDSSFSPPMDDNEQPRTKKAKQEEMDEGLLENCNALVEWLNEKESTLSSVQASAGSSPDIALINQIKDEMHGKEAEYKSLKILGEDIITEKHAAGTSCQSIEDKLNQLAELWMKLNWIIENKSSTALSVDQDLEMLHNNMEVLKDVLISCQKTVERIRNGKELPVNIVNQHLEDCKDRLHLMDINQARFRQTSILEKRLAMDEVSEDKTLVSEWDNFGTQWHKTHTELNDVTRELSVMKENQPVKELLHDLKDLQVWTSEVHQMLMDEPPVRMTFLDKMEQSLRNYSEVERSLAERQETLERINTPPKQLAEKLAGTNFQLDLVDLNTKWKDIRQYLQYNMNELLKWIEELRAFQIDMDGLKQWMVDVDTFLNINVESVEDNKTFAAVQEQFQGLEEDINVLRPTIDKLTETGRSFLRNNPKEFMECIDKCLQEMESQWTSVHTRAARQLQTVATVSAARKKNMTEMQREIQELEEIKQRIPEEYNIMSLEAFEKAIETVQEIRSTLENKVHMKNNSGTVAKSPSQDDEAVHRYDEFLHECLETVKRREAYFANISEKWRIFSEMLTEHHTWMDKLESLVSKLESCDDDKTRREQLPVLREFMNTQNSENYVTVADIAEEFDHRRMLSPLVKADLEKLRQRLSRLFKRAQEQQSLPESQSRYSLLSETGSEGATQSPFSESLERVSHLLNDLRDRLPATELKVFDSSVIAGQLHDCVQMYEKLRQIKGEVEGLIRQGHAIVEVDPMLPESESLSQRLDGMKTQYNHLGAQVTATKAELDNVVRLVTKAEKELDTWKTAMDDIDQALAELAEIAGVEDFNDGLMGVKDSVAQQEEEVTSLRNMRQRMREIAMKSTIPGFDPKYTQNSQRWLGIQNRVKMAKPSQVQTVIPQKIILPPVEIPSKEGQTGRVTVKEEFMRTVVSTTTVASEKSSNLYRQPPSKSSPPPLNLGITHLKEYQRSMQQKINAAHERVVLANVEGKKPAGREAEELDAEISTWQQRLEDSRKTENAMRKFDTFCSSCEEKLLILLRVPPASAAEVRVRVTDLEALKHDVMVNQAVYKEVVNCVDAAVTSSRDTADANQLELVKIAVNNRWTDIQEKIKITEKDLLSLLSFHVSLETDFLPWLDKTEALTVDEKFSDAERQTMLIDEKTNKLATYNMIVEMGTNVLNNVYKSPAVEPLRGQLDSVQHRWNRLGGKIKDGSVPLRSEESFDEAACMGQLTEQSNWVKRKQEELSTLQPSGDRILLQRLHDYHQLFRAQLEAKRPEIEAVLNKGRALQERLQSPTYKPVSNQPAVSMEQFSRKMEELSASWKAIFLQSDSLQQETELLTADLDSLLKLCDVVRPKLDDLERESNKWELTDEVNLTDLNKRLEEAKKFKVRVDAQSPKLEEVNSLAARIQRTPGSLSEEVVRSVEKLNKQHHALSSKIEERLSQLDGALEDVSSSSNQHILGSSVDDPWERRVSPTKVPYFINHAEQSTTWDHPKLIDLMSTLNEVNKIRFSAYRTAAKLRIVQRKLYLDLLPLKQAAEIFDKCGLRAQNAATLDCAAAVDCLMMIYERLNEENPNRINFALAIDVCLNWLLNCHDPKRTGQIPVLAFKLSLVILCQGELIDKYKYLFRLIADENQNADKQHVSQLLRHFLEIPLYLAEVAAFGGSNVEPSVQSCFEFSTSGIDIQAKQFLSWLAREPQSLVWLSVLHRLIAAEGARHPAKCNICRQFPIVGLRYRCLKCFNFDLCQSCFFTGQKSKHHKVSHPMQEYCFPASSSEDMRDFRRVLKNKLRSKESSPVPDAKQLGYLPVQPASSSAGKLAVDNAGVSTLNSQHTKGSVSSGDGAAAFTQSRVVEMDGARDMSTPEIDDEHDLIARYSSLLNGAPSTQTTVQVLQTVEREEKQEMEEYLQQLQLDHNRLIEELERVRLQHEEMPNDDLVHEASLLREDKGRLEARMKILEDHNRQLEAQLQRIKHLLEETNGHSTSATLPVNGSAGGAGRRYDSSSDDLALSHRGSSRSPSSVHNSPALSKVPAKQNSYSVGQLFHAAGSLNVAVGTLVTVMNEEERRLESQNPNANPS